MVAHKMEEDDPLVAQPLLPQMFRRPHWGGYTEAELKHAQHMWNAEFHVIPAMVVVYTGLAWCCAPAAAPEIPVASGSVAAATWLSTLVAAHVLYCSVCVTMYPTANQIDLFGVTKGPLGRYIFLTRHTIAFQAIHMLASLLAPLLSARLAAGTYAMAVPVGGFGIFVMTQFFLLARPTPEHRADSKLWHSRGVHFAFMADYIHIPCGIIAFLEVIVLRERDLLLDVMPALPSILLSYLCVSLYYIAIVHWNHALTGFWPYGFLKALGTDMAKWTRFAGAQFLILATFVMIPWTLPRIAPKVW